MSRRNVRP